VIITRAFQQIACVDKDPGELSERHLAYREQAEQFDRELNQCNVTVRVAVDSNGHSRWFGRLLELRGSICKSEIPPRFILNESGSGRRIGRVLLRFPMAQDFPRVWFPTLRIVICGNEGLQRKARNWRCKSRPSFSPEQVPVRGKLGTPCPTADAFN
jgi:hypothetical protein